MSGHPSNRDEGRLTRTRSLVRFDPTRPVDGASLAVVRIVFGAVAVLSMVRLVAYGRIGPLYTDPERHLAYPGLGFVDDLGPVGTHLLVVVLGVLGVLIATGVAARPALGLFVVGFTWLELIDAATYLNHYWFMTVLGVVLALAPAEARLAVRARPGAVPIGWIWAVRVLAGSVYTYAGLAKLNPDWLLHGVPLRLWLPARSTLPVVGPLLEQRPTALLLSWAGAVFDCSIVALLCLRRTRLAAWCALLTFHVATWVLFPIGVFPWLMIGVATVFFDPAWPARWVRAAGAGRAVANRGRWRGWVAAAWVALVVVLPLRAAVIPGDARWTSEGYRFAWNVLRVERAGDVVFRITDRDTGTVRVDTAESMYTPLQWKLMATEPELMRQAAHDLRASAEAGGADVEVRVDAFVSLNGRPAERIVDPTVDLSREPYRPLGQPWILPAPATDPP